MGEVTKAIWQWIAGNIGWIVLVILFIFSGLFKIKKIELSPLGWLIGKIGCALNKGVLEHIKTLKDDTNQQIAGLKTDLDNFEQNTDLSIEELKTGTTENCKVLQQRLSEVERSNDMQTIRQIKAHVLDFANSCMNGRRHTRKDFVNINKENKEYERLVAKYNIENDAYTDDYKYIRKKYKECRENNSFLRDPNEQHDPFDMEEEEWD